MTGLDTIFSLFLLIALGYIGRRTVVAGQSLVALNSFVYYFAVPALLFNSVYKLPLEAIFQPMAMFAFLIALVLTALLTVIGCRYLFAEQGRDYLVIRALNGTFSNYAYMGIPLVFGLLGEQAYGAMVSIILLGNVIQIGGAQFSIEQGRHKGDGCSQLWTIIKKALLQSPIFLSTLLGVLVSALQIQMPTVVDKTLDLLAPATVPVALFCLGASLEFKYLRHSGLTLVWLSLVKLIVHPLLTYVMFMALGITDRSWLLAAVFLAALPTGALAHVMAMRYSVCEKETAMAVVLSTVLSLISVSLWVGWLL